MPGGTTKASIQYLRISEWEECFYNNELTTSGEGNDAFYIKIDGQVLSRRWQKLSSRQLGC